MAKGDDSRQGAAIEAGSLVLGEVESALLRLAEALGRAREGAADAQAPAEPSGAQREVDADEDGAVTRALGLPSRAAADLTGALAASIVPAVMARIDVDALLARVDVDALVHRIDVDRLLDQIEPNRLLERVDVDELVRRVDVGAVAREALEGIDLGEVIQESTAGIGADTLEAVRVQAMHADDLVARIVDRLLFRRRPRATALEERRAR